MRAGVSEVGVLRASTRMGVSWKGRWGSVLARALGHGHGVLVGLGMIWWPRASWVCVCMAWGVCGACSGQSLGWAQVLIKTWPRPSLPLFFFFAEKHRGSIS
jgi:hypothetical protein